MVSFYPGSHEVFRLAGQRLVDALKQRPQDVIAALRHVMVLHVLPDRLDPRQLGTVTGEVDEGDPRRCERRLLLLDALALMHRVVVHHQHQRSLPLPPLRVDRRAPRHFPDELHEPFAVDRPYLFHPQVVFGRLLLRGLPRLLRRALGQAGAQFVNEAACLHAMGTVSADPIHPPPLGRLVRHDQAEADQRPTVADRQGHREPHLVAVVEVNQALLPLFSRAASSFFFAATSSGFCLCFTLRAVRFHDSCHRRRKRRRWAALTRTPNRCSIHSANCGAVQVRSPFSSSRRTASPIAGVRREGRPTGGRSVRASKPAARNVLIQCRTRFSLIPRWRAIWGTLRPLWERRTISSRSRVRGRIPGAWVRRCNSRCCSSLNCTRYKARFLRALLSAYPFRAPA